MPMKISFNLIIIIIIIIIRNMIYCVDLWCSHNTEGQICQDTSDGVEIGTGLEKLILTSGFLDVFMALRRTTLPFLTFYFY